MNDWKHFEEVDFSANTVHIDTRDFHCSVSDALTPVKDIGTLAKYKERFFFDWPEIKPIIERLYKESGGEGEWRFLALSGDNYSKTSNWQLKYIRIYRTGHGWIIGDSDNRFHGRDFWNSPIEMKYLNKH